MAAIVGPVTPQRPLPGAFMNTPAPSAPTIFAAQAASLRQNPHPPSAVAPTSQASASRIEMEPVAKAAETINNSLGAELRFPELESYIQQGASSDYELPSNPAWLPFQMLKMYDLPPRILEQASRTGVGMFMGIFPSLTHAWVALDNCLYMWDYTLPNPDLIGFEENTNTICSVKLVRPKPGVFVGDIRNLIVVATTTELLLLGVAVQSTATGANTIVLYNTRMSISVRGLQVNLIEACKDTGRIFFSGESTDDIYEFHYQQEEGWFRGKTSRLCHTKGNYDLLPDTVKTVTSWISPQQGTKRIQQMVIDHSRRLLYTLTNTSEINIYAIRDHQLVHALKRVLPGLLQNTGHFTNKSELLNTRDAKIVTLSTIPKAEATKLSLMATTNTGCRLYISITQGYGNPADANNPPTGMHVLHIRFPPKDPDSASSKMTNNPLALTSFSNPTAAVANDSHVLDPTFTAYRFAPGYFLAFQPDPNDPKSSRVFCAAPDSARLKTPQDSGLVSGRFFEFGQWISLPADLQQVQLITNEFAASKSPQGFGNEMAVQFDQTATEIAIMTSTGVQTIRRRRLVDVFAGIIRYSPNDDEGREGDIKRLIRTYGRVETVATALAVACGQALDVSPESRITSVTEPDVIEGARKVYIEYGGKAEYNPNAVESSGLYDNVRPSPRHDGTALYLSRLVRSVWREKIMVEVSKPGEALRIAPAVSLDRLRGIQRDLNALSEFLERNKSFIEGLSGPNPLARPGSRQEELALSGEHRAMLSLQKLIGRMIEGISFVLVLFDERVEDILNALNDENRSNARQLTFEGLFVSSPGRELARELVKAIVNRNIANGSNVDTVAEALRRRCGSFCSADDVIIFKAQEQLKRASEASQGQSEAGRVLLNESQRLFQKVAGSLTYEHLHDAVGQYVAMAFYAGSIQLCLVVAQARDKAKQAQAWLRDGTPDNDARQAAFEKRKQCYDLIFATIQRLDEVSAASAEPTDGQLTLAARRRREAYDVLNSSDDTVFLTCLYDWYLQNGQADRLLDIDRDFVVEYLQRRSNDSRQHADLLWRYFAHHHDYLRAAAVQLNLARGDNNLTLEERIGYLSRARTNASTRQAALADTRQSKQQLLREISDLLDVANIQDDILQRMKEDSRLTPERRPQILGSLNGQILPVEELFNQYADQADYHDICLLIYQVADHRNPADIRASWEKLIEDTDMRAIAEQQIPWEMIGTKVVEMGRRLNASDAIFPIHVLVPLLERYYIGAREHHPPGAWPIDTFIKEPLEVPHETVLPALEALYYGNEQPFHTPAKRRVLANQMVYLLRDWVETSERKGERILCGSEENTNIVQDCLASLIRSGDLEDSTRRQAEEIVQALASRGFTASGRR